MIGSPFNLYMRLEHPDQIARLVEMQREMDALAAPPMTEASVEALCEELVATRGPQGVTDLVRRPVIRYKRSRL
jgi:hypothetical protein